MNERERARKIEKRTHDISAFTNSRSSLCSMDDALSIFIKYNILNNEYY